jgi:hypothetical protein
MALYNTGFADAVNQQTTNTLLAKREIEVPEPQQPEDKDLTLADIAGSQRLTELGAQAGDRIENGKLVRVWSEDKDAVDLGTRLTAMDFIEDPTLTGRGAEVGDRLVNGEIVKSGFDSAYERWMYEYDANDGIAAQVADTLERWMPLGSLSQTSEEREAWREQINNASDERARNLIRDARERELQANYDPLFLHEMAQREGATGFAGGFGAIAGTIVDPTTLLFPTASVGKAAVVGGGMGLTQSVAEDYASRSGEVSVPKAIASTGAGMLLGAGGQKLANTIVKKVGERANKSAENFLKQAEDDMQRMVNNGMPRESIAEYRKGIQPRIDAAEKMAGRTVNEPTAKPKVDQILDDAIANDSATARVSNGWVDRYLGTLSTRIRNISEPVFGRMRKFEFDIHKKTHDRMLKVDGWTREFYKLPAQQRKEIGKMLSNRNYKAAEGLMPRAMQDAFQPVKEVIKEVGGELGKRAKFDEIENYFPRLVKDWEGLQAKLPQDQSNFITRSLQAYANKKHGGDISQLTDTERFDVINKAMRGFSIDETVDGAKLKYLKERSIEKLDDNLYEHYADAGQALQDYIRKSTHEIEKRNFFGRYVKEDDMGVDLNESIGNFMDAAKGNLNDTQASELQRLIQARFKGGELSPSVGANRFRNLGYATTIGNPLSAIVQLGDLATSAAFNGMVNTLKSVLGKRYTKLVDIGLDQTLSEELANPSRTTKLLNDIFKLSGFKAVDRLGKEVTMNAALRKNFSLVKNAKGEAAFRKKWEKIFGSEIDSLVADLKAGDVTDNVKLLAFNELSDIQPVSLMEMPEEYLRSRNGRLLYMLKSFVLKQWDVARRNIYEEMRYGDKVKGVRNLGVLGLYLTAGNAGTSMMRDFLSGKDIDPKDLPNRAMWSLLGVYGLDKYSAQRYWQHGEAYQSVINTIAPAAPLIDAAFKATADGIKYYNDLQEKPSWTVDAPNFAKVLKPVPVAGNIVYNWFFGGAEKYNEDLRKERMNELFSGK